MSSLAVIGTGYVGLTSGVCFAQMGHHVTCLDIDEKKVSQLKQGIPTIHESGISQLLSEGIESGHLRFTTSVKEAVENCDFVMLCVPTPSKTDGSVDFSYVKKASESFRDYLKPGAIVINKSTVPVGSAKLVEVVLQRPDVSVVSNPEFLREGSAVEDFFHPDRIVVGATDVRDAQKVADLYKDKEVPLVLTDPATAVTIKYAANAFLATKLSFINAVAAICDRGQNNKSGQHFTEGRNRLVGRSARQNAEDSEGSNSWPRSKHVPRKTENACKGNNTNPGKKNKSAGLGASQP